MLVTIAAKGVSVDKTEHFYQTKYSYSEDISLYKELKKVEVSDDFFLPEANPFIPKKASVPGRGFKTDVFPELISEKNGHKLYFGQDHQFLRPKGVISFKVLLPNSIMSLKHRVAGLEGQLNIETSLNFLD